MTSLSGFVSTSSVVLQRMTLVLILACGAFALTATLLASIGIWPWLTVDAGIGETLYPQAGMYVQIGLTGFVVMLMFFLPSNGRIMALEGSHRDFQVKMEDVARAYHMAHAADRASTFRMASEFDDVKNRLSHMRKHPDLGDLEPDVLELAAQMSRVSQDLAQTYSDEKVDRARAFLTQRQQEIDTFNTRMEEARIILHELGQWTRDVEIEESIARSQMNRLRQELFDLLPELSAQLSDQPEDGDASINSVVPMAKTSPRGKD